MTDKASLTAKDSTAASETVKLARAAVEDASKSGPPKKKTRKKKKHRHNHKALAWDAEEETAVTGNDASTTPTETSGLQRFQKYMVETPTPEEKMERLRSVRPYLLDNSMRESTVVQVYGHGACAVVAPEPWLKGRRGG